MMSERHRRRRLSNVQELSMTVTKSKRAKEWIYRPASSELSWISRKVVKFRIVSKKKIKNQLQIVEILSDNTQSSLDQENQERKNMNFPILNPNLQPIIIKKVKVVSHKYSQHILSSLHHLTPASRCNSLTNFYHNNSCYNNNLNKKKNIK